ncbi:MAG: DUF5615 family PIN-like protein [Aggregatilineales bacterium]
MANVRFYLDENVPIAIALQLRRRGIDVVTVVELEVLGASDASHLARATKMGYVLCTNDSDFMDLATHGTAHTGIVFGQSELHTIGDWVTFLVLVQAVYTAEDMQDRIEFVKR